MPGVANSAEASSGRFWPVAGAAVIEINAELLAVQLLVPVSGMEQRAKGLSTINHATALPRISSST